MTPEKTSFITKFNFVCEKMKLSQNLAKPKLSGDLIVQSSKKCKKKKPALAARSDDGNTTPLQDSNSTTQVGVTYSKN